MRSAVILSAAYLLGSIPCAWLVVRLAGRIDLRHAGSGNIGATNVLRTAGVAPALVALLLDVAKGAAAAWLARRLGAGDVVAAAAGLLAIIGHVLPVWLGFRGGKGVATAAGVFAVLAPRACLVALAVFGITVLATRYVSLGSILAALALAVSAMAGGYPRPVVVAAVLAAALILIRHAENLDRLRNGREWHLGSWR